MINFKKLIYILKKTFHTSNKKVLIFVLSIIIAFIFWGSNQYLVENILKINVITLKVDDNIYNDYTEQFRNLIKNNSFIADNGKILNRYAPGFPVLLFLEYKLAKFIGIRNELVFIIVSAILNAFSAIIIFDIANLIFNKRLSFWAAIFFITHPYILQGLSKAMSVTPFNTFFYLSLFIVFRMTMIEKNKLYNFLLAGILIGIAMLFRPIGLFIPIIFAGLIFISFKKVCFSRRIISGLLIILGSLLAIFPWHYFNYKNDQRILLSSDRIVSMMDGISFNYNPFREEMINLPDDVEKLTYEIYSNSKIKTRKDFFEFCWQKFWEKPIVAMKLIGIKALRSWYGTYEQSKKKEMIKIIMFVIYFIPVIFSVFFVRNHSEQWKLFLLFIVTLTLYFWCMTVLVLSMARYMIPIFGLWVILLPVFIEKVYKSFFVKLGIKNQE